MPCSIALLFLLSTSAYASELKCISGQIRWLHEKKQSQETMSYCTNNDGTIFVSQKCYKTQCWKNLVTTQAILDGVTEQEMGSPGFALCRIMEGVPQIIEFEHQKRWVSLDLCRLKGSDVDTGYLYKILRDKVKASH